jgi:hypothetical protein
MNRLVLSLVGLALLLLGANRNADAAIIINVQQVGSDLTGLIFVSSFNSSAGVTPSAASIFEGSTSGTPSSIFSGVMGPAPFGAGGSTGASSGSGDSFGVLGDAGAIVLPSGYTSGTSLSATDTYSGKTFASLGLTPGTYTYTWGTGDKDHTLTVQIGLEKIFPPVAPEPASLAIWSLGALGCAIGGAWRRRKLA